MKSRTICIPKSFLLEFIKTDYRNYLITEVANDVFPVDWINARIKSWESDCITDLEYTFGRAQYFFSGIFPEFDPAIELIEND